MASLTINLDCLDTTEAGEDEIYILFAFKTSDGRQGGGRIPADRPGEEEGHFNMNDGERSNSHINGISIHSIDISPGQSVSYVVLIMEEDGGTSATAQQLVAALLAQSGDPIALAAAGVLEVINSLGFLLVDDSDDFIGSFAVTITNSDGTLSTVWQAKERVALDDLSQPFGPNARRYFLNGDGSDYHATVFVT